MEPIDIESIPQTMKIQFFYIIHQFLREHNLTEACHEFERTYSLYFDMAYFKELIINGAWDTLEHYFGGFAGHLTNDVSNAVCFEICRQKLLEAVEWSNNAVQRVDVVRSREMLVEKLPQLVESDPSFRCKLELPQIVDGRLMTFAMHCLMLQYSKCECPMVPLSLLKDHKCPEKAGVAQQVNQSVRLLLPPPSPERQTPITTTSGSIRPRRRLIKASDKIALQQLHPPLRIEQTQIFPASLAALQDSDEGESSARPSRVQLRKKKRSRQEGNSRQTQLDIVPTSQSPPPVMEEARPIDEPVWDLNVADGSEEMAEALLMLADTTVATTGGYEAAGPSKNWGS